MSIKILHEKRKKKKITKNNGLEMIIFQKIKTNKKIYTILHISA